MDWELFFDDAFDRLHHNHDTTPGDTGEERGCRARGDGGGGGEELKMHAEWGGGVGCTGRKGLRAGVPQWTVIEGDDDMACLQKELYFAMQAYTRFGMIGVVSA